MLNASLVLALLVPGQVPAPYLPAQPARIEDTVSDRSRPPAAQSVLGDRGSRRAEDAARERAAGRSHPAGAGDAVVPAVPNRDSSGTARRTLLADLVVPPEQLSLRGRPLSLEAALARTTDAAERIRAVQHYWRLVAAIAVYTYALDESSWLDALPDDAETAWEQARFQAARARAQAEAQAARVELVRQQALLKQSLWMPIDQWPWPTDLPLTDSYQTRLKSMDPNQVGPERLRDIDRLLPELFQEMQLRAAHVTHAERAVAAAGDAFQRRQESLPGVLDAFAEMRRARRQMLSTVVQYNGEIAEYAMTVTAQRHSPAVLVSTLIRTSTAAGSARGVQTASAETPAEPVPTRRR